MSDEQADAYLDAVDAASDRVASGTYATSAQGRPLRYAVVGRPENVTPEGLEAIRQDVLRIRDPSTPAGRGGGARGDHARVPLHRRQRPRERGERGRRLAADPLRPRRSHGLRGPGDPGQRGRVHPADPEPGRSRGRYPPQRLRLRHEPRLVRPHPARDRREGRAAADVPAAPVRRRPRVRLLPLVLRAQRRSRVPRRARPGPVVDRRPLRAGARAASSAGAAGGSSTTTATTSSCPGTGTRSRPTASWPPASRSSTTTAPPSTCGSRRPAWSSGCCSRWPPATGRSCSSSSTTRTSRPSREGREGSSSRTASRTRTAP